MKYFLDTEFIENVGNIELISIGIVAEDGRSYYRVHNGYNFRKADDWVKQNVILPLYVETVHGDARNRYDSSNFHKYFGKPIGYIKDEIIEFIGADSDIEFYGYYSDYDWVIFCWIFGRMIDLPKGFPMYCRDLKQMLDECYVYQENKYEGETRLKSWLKFAKNSPFYPKQENEHSALDDAKWNFELYKFITQKKWLNQGEGSEWSVATEVKSELPKPETKS